MACPPSAALDHPALVVLTATVAIVGPTGTGKTALAAALADRRRCHLISCDAVQIYRDLRAATAKPEGAERRHAWALIDTVSPHTDIDLGQWVRSAEAELRWAVTAQRLPIVVGGTGLYLRGLAKGVAAAPGRRPELRARLERLATRHGIERLHRWLRRLDPAAADALRPRDRQRIVRALEVRVGSGRALSAWQAGGWRRPDRLPLLRIGLRRDRAQLITRLDRRVEQFFAAGLIAETRWLLEVLQLAGDANALRAIGYREVARRLLAGGVHDENALRDEVRISTRQLAKRQMTWFRAEPDVAWFDADDPALVTAVDERISAWLDSSASGSRIIGA